MPRRQERVITKRTVDALSVGHRDAVFWDRDLPGFGIRVYPSGLKKYVVQSRGPGGSKRATLGRHGKLTADEARRRAAEAIDRIKRGEDPIPPPPEPEPTMAVLAERYMRDYVPSHCRASSAEVYRRALDNHILPALGGMPVGAVGREQVAELHYAMRGAPHAANGVLKIVAKMLSLAVEWGLREHGPNPCRAVRKYRTHPRERFLTDEEYCRLGRAVDELEAKGKVSRHAAAAIRLLVLTGCRRNEVLELRWDDIDRTAGELRLRDGKTGARMVPLTPAVAGVLAEIPRVPDNPWVIAGQKPGARMTNVNDPWLVVRARAGLEDVRIHDLRHSWASRALALGESLRVRPETLCRITEFSEHESNGRELDEGERVAVEVLPVLGQSAAAVEPGDGAFDHPTPGLDDEALHPIGSLDDLGLEIGQDAGQGAVKDRPLIGAVGEQFPEKGKQTEQGRQQRETAVAILNVGGGDDAVQQQALRIDQNMPLLALDQLAGIEAVAVDASPPFSALFTL